VVVVDARVDDPDHDLLTLRAGKAAGRGAVVDPARADPRGACVRQELPRLVGLEALHARDPGDALGLALRELERHAVVGRAVAELHRHRAADGDVDCALDGVLAGGEVVEVRDARGA
jgi:hypothetical protein